MSLFNVTVRAGKNYGPVNLTVLAPSRGQAIRIAQDNVREKFGLRPQHSVLGTAA